MDKVRRPGRICLANCSEPLESILRRGLKETPHEIVPFSRGFPRTEEKPREYPDLIAVEIPASVDLAVELLVRLKEAFPDCRFLLIGDHIAWGKIFRAVDLGYQGHLSRSFCPEALLQMVERLLAEDCNCTPGRAGATISRPPRG